MEMDYRKGFARIRYSSSASESANYAGCGFLMDSQYLVTCHHVLEDAAENIALDIGMEFRVDFPFLTKKEIRMKLIKFLERRPNPMYADLEDMALLEFVEATDAEEMQSLLPLLIAYPEMEAQDGHDIEIYSAMATKPLSGKCNRSVDKGWIATIITDANVQPGDSGSPIWNKNLKSITGMLVARQNANQTCYFIPTVKIRQAFAELLTNDQAENTETEHKASQSQFLTKIKQYIAEELDAVEVKPFRDLLRLELDKILESQNQAKIPDNRGSCIAEGLVSMLREGGDGVPAINKVLFNATASCLDKNKKGGIYQTLSGKYPAIKMAVEQILGWLLVSAVDDGNLSGLPNFSQDQGIEYFELPVATPAGVEVIISRHFQRYPKVRQEGRVLNPIYGLDASAIFSLSWSPTVIVEYLKIELWNRNFKGDEKSEGEFLTKDETEDLNVDLLTKRQYDDERYKQHSFILFKPDNEIDEASQKQIYQQLLDDLSNLTVVRFGIKAQSFFYIPERNLLSAASNFLKIINAFILA